MRPSEPPKTQVTEQGERFSSRPPDAGVSPRLLNVQEAATWLGVTASYLNKLRTVGGGPCFAKLGTRVVYGPADLADWVSVRRRTSTSDPGGNAPDLVRRISAGDSRD